MRVVFVSHDSSVTGGAELSLCELVGGLAERDGVEPHVVLPSRGPLLGRLRERGVGVSTEASLAWWVGGPAAWRHRVGRGGAHVRAIARLARLFRVIEPEVVVTNTLASPTAALAARMLRIPHVWYVHEFGMKDHGLMFDLGFERTVRLVGRLSARVIANSRSVAAELELLIPPTKVRVVRYAVEVPVRQARPRRASGPGFNLVLVGRKAPGKGQADAIRAVALLEGARRGLRLRLVGGGDPSYAETLETLAAQLGVSERVESIGPTADVLPHLEWADAALMCSHAEAFGRVTVEAMKAGRPVIGTRAGGTAELIRDGWNGLLYAPGNPHELARRIELLGSEPQLRSRLGEAAREWARGEFTLHRYVDEFIVALGDLGRGERG